MHPVTRIDVTLTASDEVRLVLERVLQTTLNSRDASPPDTRPRVTHDSKLPLQQQSRSLRLDTGLPKPSRTRALRRKNRRSRSSRRVSSCRPAPRRLSPSSPPIPFPAALPLPSSKTPFRVYLSANSLPAGPPEVSLAPLPLSARARHPSRSLPAQPRPGSPAPLPRAPISRSPPGVSQERGPPSGLVRMSKRPQRGLNSSKRTLRTLSRTGAPAARAESILKITFKLLANRPRGGHPERVVLTMNFTAILRTRARKAS